MNHVKHSSQSFRIEKFFHQRHLAFRKHFPHNVQQYMAKKSTIVAVPDYYFVVAVGKQADSQPL